MRAQPNTLNGWRQKIWCKFFLLAVFAVMYLRDVQNPGLYEALGLDVRDYVTYVIRKTNETSARVLPVILNVDNPKFFQKLENCVASNIKLVTIENSQTHRIVKIFQKLPCYVFNAWQLLTLFLMKTIDVAHLSGTVR